MSAEHDIFHPDWKPGKGTIRKAERLARNKRIPYEDALEQVVFNAREKLRLTWVANEAQAEEVRALRAEVKQDKRSVFPEPQSIRAIPTAIETQRRGH